MWMCMDGVGLSRVKGGGSIEEVSVTEDRDMHGGKGRGVRAGV